MKNKTTAALLAIFLGGIGGHKFYLGKPIQGIIYLIFCWTWIPLTVGLIEGIMYLAMSEQAFQEKYGNQDVQPSRQQRYNSSNSSNSLSKETQTLPPVSEGRVSTLNEVAYTPLAIPPEIISQSPSVVSLEPERIASEETLSEQNENNVVLSDEEIEYLEEFKTYALDGEISDKERRLLDRLRDLSGISIERANYIETLI